MLEPKMQSLYSISETLHQTKTEVMIPLQTAHILYHVVDSASLGNVHTL